MGSSSNNIAISSDPTYQAIYNAVNGECEISGIQSVIHSTNYIEDIRDLSLYWNSCDAGRVYVCYKTKTSDWSYLTDFSGTSANDGTNEKQSLNRRQLIVDINNEDFTDKLFGKDAQIAFMFSSNTDDTSKSYICLQGMYVNKIKAIKAKMNYWNDNETPLCSGSLTNPKSLEYADLYFTNYSLSVAEANEMNELIPSKSLTYFSQFEYLCGIAGINVKEHPSFYGNNNLFNSTNIGTIVVVLASTACLLLTTTIFVVYRTKRREQ